MHAGKILNEIPKTIKIMDETEQDRKFCRGLLLVKTKSGKTILRKVVVETKSVKPNNVIKW